MIEKHEEDDVEDDFVILFSIFLHFSFIKFISDVFLLFVLF